MYIYLRPRYWDRGDGLQGFRYLLSIRIVKTGLIRASISMRKLMKTTDLLEHSASQMLFLYRPERRSYQGPAEGCEPCPITPPEIQKIMIENQNPQLNFPSLPFFTPSKLSVLWYLGLDSSASKCSNDQIVLNQTYSDLQQCGARRMNSWKTFCGFGNPKKNLLHSDKRPHSSLHILRHFLNLVRGYHLYDARYRL